jgi:hypothetical protein
LLWMILFSPHFEKLQIICREKIQHAAPLHKRAVYHSKERSESF